jgi:hypothetical protein
MLNAIQAQRVAGGAGYKDKYGNPTFKEEVDYGNDRQNSLRELVK